MKILTRVLILLPFLFPYIGKAQYCGAATTNVAITPTTTSQLTASYSSGRRAFNFVATAGCVYEFSTCGQTTGDTYLRLYSTATGGTLLAQNDNFCGTQSTLTWTATVNGTVSILLTRASCNALNSATKMSYRKISCSAPSCATLIDPSDGAVNTTIGQTLSWNAINIAISYDVYFGTNSSPPFIVNQTGITYNPGTLSYNTTYYWKIIPKNSNGDAVGCSTWSFTTSGPGCLTAMYGLYPSATYNPNCTGVAENITTVGYAGEYSNVALISNVNYTMSSSIATDFITISNNNGDSVLAYGTGSVIFNCPYDGIFRFYTHTDNFCNSSATSRTRKIQCTTPPPPINDLCVNAIDVGCGGTFTGNTKFATNNDGPSCLSAPSENWTAPGVWYKVTGNGQTITASLCGSSYDTKIFVYTGSCGAFTCLASNDDNCFLQSQVSFNSTNNTIYHILVTGYGSAKGAFTLSVTIPPSPPVITSNPISTAICYQQTDTLSVAATGVQSPFTYQWYLNNNPISGATTNTLVVNVGGNYYATVTNACNVSTNSGTATVLASTQITLSTAQQNVACYGTSTGAINLTVTGGLNPKSYLWSNGATTEDLTNLIAGTYSVTVTDGVGCQKTTTVTILQNTQIVLATSKTNVSCFGGNDGMASIAVSGGSIPYSYYWSNGSNQPTINNLTAGNYSLNVIDVKGCSKSTIIPISQPSPISVSLVTVTNESCGGSGGSVDVNVFGGTPPYVYAWNNGTTSQDLTNVPAGNYVLTTSDSKNCLTNFAIGVNKDTCNDPEIVGSDCGMPLNTVLTYSISNVSNTTCTWSVPYGVVIISGQGTATCGIKFSTYFVGGNVDVIVTTPLGTFTLSKPIYKNPLPPNYINGPSSICADNNTIYEYYASTVSTATGYFWTLPTGVTLVSGQGNDTIQVKFNTTFTSGIIDVQSYNQCGTSAKKYYTIINSNFNTSPGAIIGPIDLCPYLGSTVSYSVAASPGYTFNWVTPINTTIVSGQGTNVITLQVSSLFTNGILSVNKQNSCGVSQTSSLSITTLQTILSVTNISGITSVCSLVGTSSTTTYSISPVTGATGYAWFVPANCVIVSQSTNYINVKFLSGFTSGTISVIVSSGCSSPVTRSINVTTTMPSLSTISGPKCIENGLSYTYSISPATGALSYSWSVPGNATITSGQNTNSIVVYYPSNFEQSICQNNLCDSIRLSVNFGCGVRTKAFSLGMVTYKPTVTGPMSACYPDTIQLTATNALRATSYLWQGPNGTQIIGSNSGSSILSKINTTFLGGTYMVQSINQCGTSPIAYYTVNKVCGAKMSDTMSYFENYLDHPLNFIVFPNPTNGILHLRVYRGDDNEYLLIVADQLGNIIYTDRRKSEDELNFRFLNPGMYFITIYDSKQQKITKNFIKVD